ncbi:heterokaryon incompatibility protein-domain-containing protein [Apiospora sp. TS-2023a]
MTIKLKPQADRGFHFIFRGCNCGKSTGLLGKETIPDASQQPHTADRVPPGAPAEAAAGVGRRHHHQRRLASCQK